MAQHRYRQNKVKREHTIIEGLLPVLEQIATHPKVQGITPGRINKRSSNSEPTVTAQYKTETGLKLLGRSRAAVQEVFIVTDEPETVLTALVKKGLVKAPSRPNGRSASSSEETGSNSDSPAADQAAKKEGKKESEAPSRAANKKKKRRRRRKPATQSKRSTSPPQSRASDAPSNKTAPGTREARDDQREIHDTSGQNGKETETPDAPAGAGEAGDVQSTNDRTTEGQTADGDTAEAADSNAPESKPHQPNPALQDAISADMREKMLKIARGESVGQEKDARNGPRSKKAPSDRGRQTPDTTKERPSTHAWKRLLKTRRKLHALEKTDDERTDA